MDETRCYCICRRSGFDSRQSLARHRQSCAAFHKMMEADININPLRSTSIHRDQPQELGGNAAEDGDGITAPELVYDMDNYDAASIFKDDLNDDDDDTFNETSDIDDYSATMSDSEDDNYENYDDDGMEYQDHSDNSFIPSSSDSSIWSTSSSSSSSSMGSSRSNLPTFTPPMFDNKPIHFSAAYKLQSQLNNLFDKHKASISMYNEMVELFNNYISSSEFNRYVELQTRQQFIASSAKMFGIQSMAPEYSQVRMSDNSVATVPVFDAKAMILSLLHDPLLMRKENFADGYNIFNGEQWDGAECNTKYGEIHTGDAWEPALRRFCGNERKYMPIALVLFGDKSHTDLHGTLSVEPVTFTLSLFNRSARNLPQFWRLLGYIPNLSAGKGESNRMSAADKVQNEHVCLSRVFKSLRDIYHQGGIRTSVMGRDVHLKVWVHYIIGDTEGNNKWLGHYPGNNSGIARPYRDCQCCFADMARPVPKCVYTTLQEMETCRSLLETNEAEGVKAFKAISRYPIKNALLERGMQLSDAVHGPYRMTPPELLHTSGAGLIMYMFKTIAERIGAGINRDDLDKQHSRAQASLNRQSERDLPRGATRNGIVDGTKCQASERRGNFFSLACIAHTADGRLLKECLDMSLEEWKTFLWFMKQYLALEDWFHCANDKAEVILARRKIGKILKRMQTLFPRGEGTNGYNIPKMHGMAKMVDYICLFGSGINFFGGPGESSHKQFVKSPGLKTQRRVKEFASQVAKQHYHVMVSQHVHNSCVGASENDSKNTGERIVMEGKYTIDVTAGGIVNSVSSKKLRTELVRIIERDRRDIMHGNGNTTKLTGYTRARFYDASGVQSIYYAHPSYRGSPWYDWVYVHFWEDGEENYYPSLILGYVEVGGEVEACIQCSSRPLKWSTLEKNMFVAITLGENSESFVRVPLSSFVFTLCVFPDYGGAKNKYFVVLPRRGWGEFFGQDINVD